MNGDPTIISESLCRIQEEVGGGTFVIFAIDADRGYYIQFAGSPGKGLL